MIANRKLKLTAYFTQYRTYLVYWCLALFRDYLHGGGYIGMKQKKGTALMVNTSKWPTSLWDRVADFVLEIVDRDHI